MSLESFSIRVRSELLEVIRETSKSEGISQSKLIEKAMSAYLGNDSIDGDSDRLTARVRELELWQSEVEMKLNFLRERTEPQTPPKVKKGFGR